MPILLRPDHLGLNLIYQLLLPNIDHRLFMKKTLPNTAFIAALLLFPSLGFAQTQTIETVVNNLFTGGHLAAVAQVLEALAYLGGIGLGMKAAFKLQEWNDSKGRQAKLSTAIILIICAGLMFGLPALIKIGSETLLGKEASTTFNSSSGNYGGQY